MMQKNQIAHSHYCLVDSNGGAEVRPFECVARPWKIEAMQKWYGTKFKFHATTTTVPRAAAEHRNDLNIATVISVGRLSCTLSFALIAIPINLTQCQFAFNLFHFFCFIFFFSFVPVKERCTTVDGSMRTRRLSRLLWEWNNNSAVCSLQSARNIRRCQTKFITSASEAIYMHSATGVRRRSVLGRPCSLIRWTSHSLLQGVRTKSLSRGKSVRVKCWKLIRLIFSEMYSRCDYLVIRESRKKPRI